MNKFTIYTADCKENPQNRYYHNEVKISNVDDLKKAIEKDHVCAKFIQDKRSKSNFLSTDVEMVDCDNEFSDNPEHWIHPEDLEKMLNDVSYAVVPSRNNMKRKGNQTERPRFHIYFPHKTITDVHKCEVLKQKIFKELPFVDKNALDAARLVFGSDVDEIKWHEGKKSVIEFLREQEQTPDLQNKKLDTSKNATEEHKKQEKLKEEIFKDCPQTIQIGTRNHDMSQFAGKLIVRYGNTKEAHDIFLDKAKTCNPPLDDKELNTIWKSASKFGKKVRGQSGYVPPQIYNSSGKKTGLKPKDFSDIGEAKVLADAYKNELVYTDSTDYMKFEDTHWVESKQKAIGLCEKFLDAQLKEANDKMEQTAKKLNLLGIQKQITDKGYKCIKEAVSATQNKKVRKVFEIYEKAYLYEQFVMKRRDMKYVTSTLQAAKPMLLEDIEIFDKNQFYLNTPNGTYDLRTGKMKKHDPKDFITKITAVSPDSNNKDIWEDALNVFFCADAELIEYVQRIIGLAAIGKVYQESIIILHGEGKNGKSSFGDAIASVLGDYSGNLSADVLIVGCRRNVKPEMAELRGKRLVIAAELEEGTRMNTSVIKQICSTDRIRAEKKYKDPFDFAPSHTLVLYTNHLPRVGASDNGTWRRILVIPFNATIKKDKDIKNYAEYLYEKAGGAILSWIIEGAQKAIKDQFKFKIPQAVEKAIGDYKEENDWLAEFITERCELDKNYEQKSGEFYQAYRNYSMSMGEYARSAADFYAGLKAAGFEKKRKSDGNYILGIRISY